MTSSKTKPIGHQLQLAARLHRAKTAAAIQDLGLFPGQENLLAALDRTGDMTVGQLARDLQVRPPTVSKAVQRLSQQGLVRRTERDGETQRATVGLTREGRRRMSDLATRLEAVEAEFSAHFDAKDQRRLRKLLKRAAKALAGAGDAGEDEEREGEPDKP